METDEGKRQHPGGGDRRMVGATINRRFGRPRANLEKRVLAEMSAQDKQLEAIIAGKINFNTLGNMVFEAASLLLNYRADPRKIELTPIYHTIYRCAQKRGPHGRWRDACDFLEEFIHYHAPNWNWRAEAVKGGIERRDCKRENERIAKDIAADARLRMARATKSHTPDAPDGLLLYGLACEHGRSLRGQRRIVRRTLPTLRELKLATAIPEREMRRIMSDLRPKQGEIIKQPLRHKFSRCGAVPLRYGPRLVIGVLNELLNRLQQFSIEDEERESLRKTTLTVKRAFAARLGNSR
jgi:hypothetical protein